ncbi:coiled-coil protein [Sesbania bispinosa]|nr:coiled-coil protein [Sesbania bispinosa]
MKQNKKNLSGKYIKVNDKIFSHFNLTLKRKLLSSSKVKNASLVFVCEQRNAEEGRSAKISVRGKLCTTFTGDIIAEDGSRRGAWCIAENQKKRVAEEDNASRKRGLGIRLLPASEEDSSTAAEVKFSTKFDKNRKDKRALINAASIFPLSVSSISDKRLELESKRRKIAANRASSLLAGGFKPSSWSQGVVCQAGKKKLQ